MAFNPLRKLFVRDLARGNTEDYFLLFFNGGVQFRAVHDEGDFQGGMTYPLVAVNERVIAYQKETEGSGLRYDRWVEVFASECLEWLTDTRLKRRPITDARSTTRLRKDPAVKLDDFFDREVAH